MNNVSIIGRLGQDPELRFTSTNKAVVSMSVAVNRPGAKEGQKKADFIPVVAWGKLAEICSTNLTKGRMIGVEGFLQIQDFETTDGQKRHPMKVVAKNIQFLDYPKQNQSSESTPESFGSDVFPQEEIPF